MHSHTCLSRRVLIAALLGAGLAASAATPALAQADPAAGWPKQPIKIIVGFTPGGSNDLLARILAQKFGERLGQPSVVENKPGAGAIIATEFVARSNPDGYTLLMAPAGTLSINPAVYAKLPYDPIKSFEHVSAVATYPFILSVGENHPAKSMKELIEWGKANPDKANYASTSTIFQLITELFNTKAGTKFVHIPFKSGGEIVTAILNGQVAMAFADTGPVLPHIKSGKIRALATSGPQRLADLPNVPTVAEAGLKDVAVEGYSGIVAPKGTPAGIVKKLEAELIAIAKLPDVQDRLRQLGMIPVGETSAQFKARIEREIPLYTGVAKAANIKLEL